MLKLTPLFFALALQAQPQPAVAPAKAGRPNPDAAEKPSPRDLSGDLPRAAKSPQRTPSAAEERPLVGEPVSLGDALKLLNKLKNFSGKIEGAKPAQLKQALSALLAGEGNHRADALGCDKLNPLTDDNERTPVMECTLQYTIVSKEMDTLVEINFGVAGWEAATAKIKDAAYRVSE